MNRLTEDMGTTTVEEEAAAAEFETSMRDLARLDFGRFARMFAVVEALVERSVSPDEVIAYQAVGDLVGLDALVAARRARARAADPSPVPFPRTPAEHECDQKSFAAEHEGHGRVCR